MYIKIKDQAFECKPAMTPLQLANQFLCVVLSTMEQDIAKVPDEHKQTVRDHYYDNFNLMASEFLKVLDPERDLRPDLTADAILKAEEELLKEGDKRELS